jgi:outer membrane lipoprotein-sorting protein
MRAALLLMLCFAAFAHAQEPAPSTAAPLTQLLAPFAEIRESTVRFTEVRKSATLEAPLTYRGVLSYTAPDRLVRENQSPIRERYLVEGDKLTLELNFNGQRSVRELKLSDIPGLHGFLGALRAVLAGDVTTLERLFRVRLSGESTAWALTLTPRKGVGLDGIQEIRLRGAATDIHTIETLETSGDSSQLKLTRDVPAHD